MPTNVVALALDGVAPFELGTICEVFGLDRDDAGLPTYEFAVASVRPGAVRTSGGFDLVTRHGLGRLAEADLVAVPAAGRSPVDYPAEALQGLRDAAARGARVMSVCSGAFVLGAAGLLDGRRCTTHWLFTDELSRQFPAAEVVPDVLYVEDGNVLTSAGTSAGIDLCLHVVRQDHGAAVANAIARRMVVPPHRDGGQAQYIDLPMPECDSLGMASLLAWMTENLAVDHTVEQLARRMHQSPRTFARRFRAETGSTPYHWLTGQRVLAAQRRLEETDESLEQIADECGFGTAAVMRHHFVRWRSTTPQAYRRAFRRSA